MGFTGQPGLLEQVGGWLPEGVAVRLLADRFYPSVALFEWLIAAAWQYRLRLKGNLLVDVGGAGVGTTGELAAGVRERYEAMARLFDAGVPTAIGVLHEAGHPEPWIIAMDCPPNRAAVKDYGARWGIEPMREPMFADFKSRGFCLEDTQLEAPKRLDCLILIMALAMYWGVRAGQEDARSHPTVTEKKRVNKPIPIILGISVGDVQDCGSAGGLWG